MNSTVRVRWVPPSQVQVPTFQIDENSFQVWQRELHIISMKLQREELHNSNTLKVIVVLDPANQNQHNQEKKKCSNKKLQGKSVTDKSIWTSPSRGVVVTHCLHQLWKWWVVDKQAIICSNSSANSYPNNKSAWILSTFCSWILTCFCCMSQWRNREELRS